MGLFADLLFGMDSQSSQRKKPRPWESNSELFKDPHSPSFIDYRDKWGSNNDHNWEADGDMRWDSYK